jgi:endoglucanase
MFESTRREYGGLLFILLLVLQQLSCMVSTQRHARAQTDVPDAFSQNERLGRAVNIIGYDPLWRSRDRARMQNEHFKLIKEAGFNSVRINLHPFRHMEREEPYTLRETWFETLGWAVEQALANGLMVILDLHEHNAMGRDPKGNRGRFLAFWRQIAERYRDAPGSVLFEILNEPNQELTPELWNEYFAEALAIIREHNQVRIVVIGPGYWNSIDALERLELPQDDRKIIATVHYYQPMQFTHQGATWVSGMKDVSGVEWRATDEEKQAIRNDFAKVQSWSKENNRPILLGEFGAYDKADMPSRVRYMSFVARQAERMGWSWAYWQFDHDFILYDIPKGEWVEPIRNALIPPAE